MNTEARIKYASVRKAAEFLRIEPHVIRAMVNAGDFEGVIRIGDGRLARIPSREVERFVGVIRRG